MNKTPSRSQTRKAPRRKNNRVDQVTDLQSKEEQKNCVRYFHQYLFKDALFKNPKNTRGQYSGTVPKSEVALVASRRGPRERQEIHTLQYESNKRKNASPQEGLQQKRSAVHDLLNHCWRGEWNKIKHVMEVRIHVVRERMKIDELS